MVGWYLDHVNTGFRHLNLVLPLREGNFRVVGLALLNHIDQTAQQLNPMVYTTVIVCGSFAVWKDEEKFNRNQIACF